MKLLPLFLLLGGALMCLAEEVVSPTNFGIKDGTVPDDPRQAGRRGQFMDFPTWQVSKELPNDVFTFARLRYTSQSFGFGRRGCGKWSTDYPDADLNFSYRL